MTSVCYRNNNNKNEESDFVEMNMRNQLKLPNSDILFSGCSSVAEITAPMKSIGVKGFSYVRVYDDGSMIDLSNRIDMMEYNYCDSSNFQNCSADVYPEALVGKHYLFDCEFAGDKSMQILHDDFGINQALVFANRRQDYFEIFWYMSPEREKFINYVIHNAAKFKQFNNLFVGKAKNVINRFERDKMVRQLSPSAVKKSKSFLEKNLSYSEKVIDVLETDDVQGPIGYQLNEFDPSVKLSKKDISVLWLLAQGKTAREVSDHLGLSRRTIEYYINKLKAKFKCKNKPELISKIIEDRMFAL